MKINFHKEIDDWANNISHLLISLIIIMILLSLTSCRTTKYTKYYDSGQIEIQYESSGFIQWSDGNNKNLPLSHISISGINAGF